MKSITRQKDFQEIKRLLSDAHSVYILGCGNCATFCKTGGVDEVAQMKANLEKEGKKISGASVIPVACDALSYEALKQESKKVQAADAVLVMSCSFGVQSVAEDLKKKVVPALDTLFIGKENKQGDVLSELCRQCGECVIGETAGICPLTACHKGLLNGPCGGMDKEKCEVDKDKDCAWVLIYKRLKEQGRLDLFKKIQPPKNHQKYLKPGKVNLTQNETGV